MKQRFRMETKIESIKCFPTVFLLPFRLYITMALNNGKRHGPKAMPSLQNNRKLFYGACLSREKYPERGMFFCRFVFYVCGAGSFG